MNRKDFNEYMKNIFATGIEINKKKAADYATEDVLSNFKRVSKAACVLNITPHTADGYARFMILMKLDRINNLVGRDTKNESIDDSIIDLIVYTVLMGACLKEKEEIHCKEETS